MVDRDLDSWLRFYDIDIGPEARIKLDDDVDISPEARRIQKERVLVKYLGGAQKRFVL
jgi:hypothetical protein